MTAGAKSFSGCIGLKTCMRAVLILLAGRLSLGISARLCMKLRTWDHQFHHRRTSANCARMTKTERFLLSLQFWRKMASCRASGKQLLFVRGHVRKRMQPAQTAYAAEEPHCLAPYGMLRSWGEASPPPPPPLLPGRPPGPGGGGWCLTLNNNYSQTRHNYRVSMHDTTTSQMCQVKTSAHLAHDLRPEKWHRDAEGHFVQPDGPRLCHDAAVTQQAEDASARRACPPYRTDRHQRRPIQPLQKALHGTARAFSAHWTFLQ